MKGVQALKVAAETAGVLTRAQALGLLTRRQLEYRLETKAWVRLFPSVYRVEGSPPTWHQRLLGFTLWAGERAVLSHRTAAALHGFEGFAEGPLDATCTRRLRSQVDVTLYEVDALSKKDVVDVGDYQVTSVARTLVDLAATTSAYTLRALVDQALRTEKLTLVQLRRQVERAKGRVGVQVIRGVLEDLEGQGGPTESELEDAALELITAAGVPSPTLQRRVVAGRKLRRLDFLFPAQRVVIEADGYATHSGKDAFEADRERDNALLARGYRVLRWTWSAIQDRGEELIAQLRAVLG